MSHQQQYDASQLDAGRIVRYATEVAASLLERGEKPRRPRPPTSTLEILSKGFFGFWQQTITRHDEGGNPQFWIVGARRERGVFIVDSPGSNTKPHGWMGGDAIVLLADGQLNGAQWRDETLDSFWTVSDFIPVSEIGLTQLDYADRAQWRKVRALRGEQHREELTDHYVLSVHDRGVGLTIALRHLLDGDGVRLSGHLTGMRQLPQGP